MKNKLFIIIVCLIFIGPYIFGIMGESLNPNDYARITDVEYSAVVVDEPGSQGKVVITERLTFDVHAASEDNLFWELWRDLPEDYVDGVKVEYKVNSVKQILEDGTEIIYDESPKLYWDDEDYINTNFRYGPGKWFHSKGPYNEADAQYECVFFYVDGLYREQVVFEIEYEMYNAALRYKDCSDLYLCLYSEDSINHLQSFKAEILFPNEDMPSSGNYEVYTYGTDANDFPVTESATSNPGYYTFSFELDEDDLEFSPYNEYIEFDLVAYGEDKHLFTEYAPSNYYSNDNVLDEIHEEQQEYASAPEKYKVIKICTFVVLFAGSVLILIYTLRTKSRMRSKHMFYKPTTKIDYYRDIPSDLDPKFAAALVFCKQAPPKDDSGIYSAILLSLARKGYIEIREAANKDVYIIIKKTVQQIIQPVTQSYTGWNYTNQSYTNSQAYNNMQAYSTPQSYDTDGTYEPLTPCEEYYFNLLVRHGIGGTISMNDFQSRVSSDYENTAAFVRNMDNSIVNIGVREGYFQKVDFTQPKKQILSASKLHLILGVLFITLVNIISYHTRMDFAFGGFFIFGISCVISSIYLKKQAHNYVLLTQFGEDEYAKWRGLYNFLNNDEYIRNCSLIELPVMEKYLVYATAFGLSEKVNDALKLNFPGVASSPILNNPYYRSRRFHHSGRSFRSAVHSGSHTYHSGAGFGYGGGGRGGGGGGGGH